MCHCPTPTRRCQTGSSFPQEDQSEVDQNCSPQNRTDCSAHHWTSLPISRNRPDARGPLLTQRSDELIDQHKVAPWQNDRTRRRRRWDFASAEDRSIFRSIPCPTDSSTLAFDQCQHQFPPRVWSRSTSSLNSPEFAAFRQMPAPIPRTAVPAIQPYIPVKSCYS